MARFLDRGAAHRPHEACDVRLHSRRARAAPTKSAAPKRRQRPGVAKSLAKSLTKSLADDPLGDAAAPVEASPKLDPGPLHDERRMRTARLLHRGVVHLGD